MYKHIILKFCVISFTNKEMVSFFQLHSYKFGLVYMQGTVKGQVGMPPGNVFITC